MYLLSTFILHSLYTYDDVSKYEEIIEIVLHAS